MSDGEGFLGRWSRRKREAKESPVDPAPAAGVVPQGSALPRAAEPAGSAPLPPVESLTPQSDFAPFMQADVDPTLKGRALKTLFGDPALYPMDGLDVYIDDYSKPDPLPEGWLAKLNQFAALDGGAQAERAQEAEHAQEAQRPQAEPPALGEAPPPANALAPEPPDESAARARSDDATMDRGAI